MLSELSTCDWEVVLFSETSRAHKKKLQNYKTAIFFFLYTPCNSMQVQQASLFYCMLIMCTLAPDLMHIALRRRLRLPLPLTALQCGGDGAPGCHGQADALGDHFVACPRAGLLPRRGAWVQVAREAVGAEGRIVPQQWLARTTAPGVAPADRRRLDLVVYGATPGGEALCCDATLVSPLTRAGRPVPGADVRDGAARRRWAAGGARSASASFASSCVSAFRGPLQPCVPRRPRGGQGDGGACSRSPCRGQLPARPWVSGRCRRCRARRTGSPSLILSLSSPISRGPAACRFGETCVHRGGVGTWITTAARGKKKIL